MQRFRISATGHSLNYLPHYVASWQGYFAQEGLDVSVTVPVPWDRVLRDLGDGDVEAVLGGIWVPSMFFGRGVRYTPFAQIAARAPLALVGRRPAGRFSWHETAGKVVAMKGSSGASIGLFVKMMLRENGVDPREVDFVQDLDGAMLCALFKGGLGDFLAIDYPDAVAFEAAGHGHIVAALPQGGGDVPWSVYYALGDGDGARVEAQARFARALGRGMEVLRDNDAGTFRDLLVKTFPTLPGAMLVRLVDDYRACGMWTTPRIDRAAHDRWQAGLAAGHLVAAPIAYDDLVDSRPVAALSG